MERIEVKHIRELRGSHEEVSIINVLHYDVFKKEHIPGSSNVPFEDEAQFVQAVEKIISSKDHKVIVHCSGPDCPLSKSAAKALDGAAFSSVLLFKGGIKEWKDAGEKVESSSRHHARP